MKERHVFIVVSEEQAMSETRRLSDLYPDAWVELSWSPGQMPNIMILPDGIVMPDGVEYEAELLERK